MDDGCVVPSLQLAGFVNDASCVACSIALFLGWDQTKATVGGWRQFQPWACLRRPVRAMSREVVVLLYICYVAGDERSCGMKELDENYEKRHVDRYLGR